MLKIYTKKQLDLIIKKHGKWLRSEKGGKRANLSGSDLSRSNLSWSDLSWSDLSGSDLTGSNLTGSNLTGSNLSRSNLSWSNLSRSKGLTELLIATTSILPTHGDIIGWKKCRNNVIVKLKIPDTAKRSNATGRKCRAEFAEVLEVIGAEIGISQNDDKFLYKVGETVKCNKWCEDRWQECAGGIHFFITKIEAENY